MFAKTEAYSEHVLTAFRVFCQPLPAGMQLNEFENPGRHLSSHKLVSTFFLQNLI
jgi:hypothetical protein